MRSRLLAIFVILMSLNLSAQMKEQRIFLWDVSESLNKTLPSGKTLFQELQENLIASVEAIETNPLNEIVLVPFYDNVIEKDIVRVKATKDGKQQVIKAIEARGKSAKPIGTRKTNIIDPILFFHKNCKDDYKNYMFLYTDGENEVKGGMPALGRELNSWNEKNSKNNKYGFYVLVDKAADQKEVRDAEKSQDNFWVVKDAKQTIKVCNLPNQVIYNIKNDKEGVLVNITGDYKTTSRNLVLKSNDQYYDVQLADPSISDGKVRIKLKYKGDGNPPLEHIVECKTATTNSNAYTFITPETLKIKVINKPERTLKVTIR